jgi:hypothetical protein
MEQIIEEQVQRWQMMQSEKKAAEADIFDPINYDMVINTQSMGVDTAANPIARAFGK